MSLADLEFLLAGIPFNFSIFLSSWGLALALSVFGAIILLQLPERSFLRNTLINLIHSWNAVPHLLIVMFAYYGLPRLIESVAELSVYWTGVLALGIAESGFFVLLWIQAFDVISPREKEAAAIFSFSVTQKWRSLFVPTIFHISRKRFENQTFILLKETALTSVIGIHELMWRSSRAMSDTERWASTMTIACLSFMAMNSVVSLGFRTLRKRGIP